MRPPRLLQSILALLLAVTVLSGSASSASWLWTCRHSGRLAAVPFAPRPGEMPCGMPMGAMARGDMPCCRRHALAAGRTGSTRAALTAPDCHPVFVKMASLPPGMQTRDALAAVAPDAAVPAAPHRTGASALTESARKQRPPPPDLPSPRDLPPSHGLRAPPAA